MMLKSFGRIIPFALLCSIVAIPSSTLRADTAQDCTKAKNIAQRVHRSICAFFTSGNPQYVVNAQTYLNDLKNTSGGKIIKELLPKIRANVTELLNRIRSAKNKNGARITDILTDAFDRFGSDIKNAACEIRAMGNTPEIQELADLLDGMPASVNREFTKITGIQKKKLGINVWLGKY